MPDELKPRVAIAGASGFVGRALIRQLRTTCDVIALARATRPNEEFVQWRACDLFNLRDAEDALQGADSAVYLVHSMLPSARLTQASFQDLDLLCADNFARAAVKNGVRHIVYLGGLLPAEGGQLSRHLESRFEVERTLAAYGVPVTTLRAGLIIGAGGSSFDMMARLVGRLPFMIGPRWTRSLSQAIALADAVSLVNYALENPELAGQAYDIAGPDVVSYADMLRMTGLAQGKRTRVITLPVSTAKLSLLWVSFITGAPQALVRPLVESLRHDMIAGDGLVLQRQASIEAMPLQLALDRAVQDEKSLARRPRRRLFDRLFRVGSRDGTQHRVFSVQRLPVPEGKDANWIADEYLRWLPLCIGPLLRVTVDDRRRCCFFIWPVRAPLLVLDFAPDRSSADRQLFYVTGGVLAKPASGRRARLEFRSVLGGTATLAAVQDFVPRLPWLIYKYTQALVHLFVMQAFARHLRDEHR